MIKLITSGESHGKYLVGILEGIPSNLRLDVEKVRFNLNLRRKGYGRSERMEIEDDSFEIFGGVTENFVTTGAPIGFLVINRDNEINKTRRFFKTPRPGHIDYAGSFKYDFDNFSIPSERRSGRLTTLDVIAGSICEQLLEELNIKIYFFVSSIGMVSIEIGEIINNIDNYFPKILSSKLLVPYEDIEEKMKSEIDKAKKNNDTVGGSGVVVIKKLPIGIGDYNNLNDTLDGEIGKAILSIPSVKGVEIGEGFKLSKMYGSEAIDEFLIKEGKLRRTTNKAGGIEGGVSNGEDIIVKFYSKPIPTILKGTRSINFDLWIEERTNYIRSDIAVVPAVTIVAKSKLAILFAKKIKEVFGGNTLSDIKKNLLNYINSRSRFWQK
ncbi:MAG: chorismate synthase [Caldisericia bacterium]